MTPGFPVSALTCAPVRARTAAADPLAPRPWPPIWATTSGPLVAALVCRYGWLVTPCRTSPRVSVAVAAVIASTSSTAGPGRCRRSRPTRRPTSLILPIALALTLGQPVYPGQGAQVPAAAAGQPGLVHERAVAHGDQPVSGGGDARVVRNDQQRLPGRVQVFEH